MTGQKHIYEISRKRGKYVVTAFTPKFQNGYVYGEYKTRNEAVRNAHRLAKLNPQGRVDDYRNN